MFRFALKSNLNGIQRSAPLAAALIKKEHAALNQQVRHKGFFSKLYSDAAASVKLETSRKALNTQPTDDNLRDYFVALNAVKPMDTIIAIEKGWTNGTVPVTEAFLKQYLAAAAKLGRLESINVSGLLAILARGSVPTPAAAAGAAGSVSEAELSALVSSALASSRASAGASGAGYAPNTPLYVTSTTSWKKEGFNLLKTCFAVFVVWTLYNVVNDDKAGAPGSGGGGGIAAKLGMGTNVKKAEASDKTFQDVVGIDEAKADLEEIVWYLKDPAKFTRLGGKLPKGVLLTGPPGTGKTLLARAIAGEAKVPFYHASGSEFDEMFVGVGAKRIREMFSVARANSPSIIFIDEIDAIGGKRNDKDQSAMRMTLNQLLVEMDGFDQNNGVIVIGATNFPDSLDKALVRPGRFDKHVDVPMPDIAGRKAILELYAKKMPVDKDVNFEQIARGTPGFSGAELYNLVNQAALKASLENHAKVGMGMLEWAKDKIMMGAQRRSAVISPETMKLTAYHEAGHALMALKTDGANPIYKATIMPRGRALGMVMQLPDGDQMQMTRKQMLAHLDVCMGGRVAEELIFGHDNVTSGATSDIQSATRLATAMVRQYGLSEKVGFIHVDEKCSGTMKQTVDEEINTLLSESYNRCKALLHTHRRELELVAKGLLEYESLSGSEIVDLIAGKALPNGVRSQKPSRATQPLPGVVASTAVRNTAAAGENGPAGSAGGSGGSAVAVNKSVSAAKADVTSAATVGADTKAQSVVKDKQVDVKK
eukprot:CAMPEP_0184967526 /NCGR_PEP_ID=MMETSP1098-20130426/877_1 /TAXON_ID=89044 /ORGANISM="Spumella elongata, Strain CCAP 955/1" /LENGTH=764 /DNA_ID=CAMNT_0027489003 /DNA_START=126 /DNA_END=2420 /DNA_ORIENTATION=+